jgi:hypothetical protein
VTFRATPALVVVALLAAMTGCAPQSPLEPGTALCVGIAPGTCQRLLADEQQENPGAIPKAYSIRCTVALCTDKEGSAEVIIAWSDGSISTLSTTWAGAAP